MMIRSVRKTLPQENMKLSFFNRIFWGGKKGETKLLLALRSTSWTHHVPQYRDFLLTASGFRTTSLPVLQDLRKGVNWWVRTSSFWGDWPSINPLKLPENSLHWAPWFPDHHSESTPHIHWHPPGYGEPCHTFHSLHQLHPWISSPFLLCIKKWCLKKLPSPCDPEWTTLEQLDANLIHDDAFIIDWFPFDALQPLQNWSFRA